FGGTNAHLVLESAPAGPEAASGDAGSTALEVLLPVSAGSPEALRALARSYRDELAALDPGSGLRDIAYSAAVRRDHHAHRLALTARNAGEAVGLLDAYLRGEPRTGLADGRRPPGRGPKLVLVFSGQGGLWPGAGRGLFEREPVFRGVIEECDRWLVRH